MTLEIWRRWYLHSIESPLYYSSISHFEMKIFKFYLKYFLLTNNLFVNIEVWKFKLYINIRTLIFILCFNIYDKGSLSVGVYLIQISFTDLSITSGLLQIKINYCLIFNFLLIYLSWNLPIRLHKDRHLPVLVVIVQNKLQLANACRWSRPQACREFYQASTFCVSELLNYKRMSLNPHAG